MTNCNPGDEGCELEDGDMYPNSITISLYEGESEDELFDVYYIPEFDVKCDLCEVSESY